MEFFLKNKTFQAMDNNLVDIGEVGADAESVVEEEKEPLQHFPASGKIKDKVGGDGQS